MAGQTETSARLSRIENKVDKLVDVVAQLSRIEERSANQQLALIRINKRLDIYEDRIESMEIADAEEKGGRTAYKWLGGIIIAVTSVIIGYLKGGGS